MAGAAHQDAVLLALDADTQQLIPSALSRSTALTNGSLPTVATAIHPVQPPTLGMIGRLHCHLQLPANGSHDRVKIRGYGDKPTASSFVMASGKPIYCMDANRYACLSTYLEDHF